MTSPKVLLAPRFLGEPGKRFLTLQMSSDIPAQAHIVYIPPFGEEMNRCRSLVSEQARFFAANGFICTLLDFVGTGDSEGELSRVSLFDWHENIRLTLQVLQDESDLPIIFWGMRLGGLIALDYIAQSAAPVKEIILWQPVTGGKLYVNQVLRQRVASLMVRDLPAETTKEIRQRLADGEDVEVAGYTLGGQLIADIEAIDIGKMPTLCSGSIHWLEHVLEPGKDLGIVSQKAIAALRDQGNTIETHSFCDPQIWQVHERDEAPELLAASRELKL